MSDLRGIILFYIQVTTVDWPLGCNIIILYYYEPVIADCKRYNK